MAARWASLLVAASAASALVIHRRGQTVMTTNTFIQGDIDTEGTIYEKGIPCCVDGNANSTLPTWDFVCSTDFADNIFRPCLVATSTPFQTRTRHYIAPFAFEITGVSIVGNTDTPGPHAGDVQISVGGAAAGTISYTLDGDNMGFESGEPIAVECGDKIEMMLQDTDRVLGEELEVKLLGFMGTAA